ncbi:hypothetical protein [Solimonas terrae]|uniref:Uncharacterized protein n=1 Tax=Solimonas terrae TaxID=1396819 RepID=A0A6M2BT70_9GAMM|nr:hypothetical protein [Solimonas terrae]NGY05167.1 hypothetical protein [Solimonas terrae]
MKDSFASLCFAAYFIVILVLGMVGLNLGGRIPFIPSNAVHEITAYWIPALLALGWILALTFHRGASDPSRRRRIVILFEKFGRVKAFLYVLLFAIFFYAIGWLGGDAGIQKSAVFLSTILPSEAKYIDVHTYGIRDFSSKTTSRKWVKIDVNGHVDDFSYPTAKLTFLPCTNDVIRVSGSATWAGLLVQNVECSPLGQ